MAQKTVLFVSGACLLTLIAGFSVGRLSGPKRLEDHLQEGTVVAREEFDALEKDLADARGKLKAASAAREDALARAKGLEEKASSLAKKMAALEAAEQAKVAAAQATKAPLTFGKYGSLEGVRNADWGEAAEAASKINELLLEMLERIRQDQPPPPDLQAKIRDENAKLIKVYGGLAGKIPTNSPMNGEYTHPICLSNIMAAMLEKGSLPLSDEQKQTIARLGGEFEEAYEEVQGRYGKETLALEKLVDEIDLKEKFMDAACGILSDEQKGIVAHPDLHDRKGLDLLSPFLSAVLFAEPRYVDKPESYRDQFVSQILKDYQLGDEQKAALQPALDEYFTEVESLLKDPRDPQKDFLELGPSLVAARAQTKILSAIAKLPGLDEKMLIRLQGNPAWIVPQLRKSG